HIQLGVLVKAECPSRAGAPSEGDLQGWDVLQGHGVDTFGLARVAPTCAEITEADVGFGERRIERERLGVAAQRELVLVCCLMRACLANELVCARRARRTRQGRRQHAREEENARTHDPYESTVARPAREGRQM